MSDDCAALHGGQTIVENGPRQVEADADMKLNEITPEALVTWGKLSPKSTGKWVRKVVLVLAVFIGPWFLIPWRYALLFVFLVLAIENAIDDAVPVIVALAKQEIVGPQ